ncbi:MAG: hypothetical protein A2X36_08100 [Elusimicrobia bacterium GWA2_69_24]|nr:MAG: hypothetical protein A2X36_08100 [Elusimicrobia bacterium GWA2_69_24]HBL18602.1 hypothetical protein [Elusimicrobiota bacterium]
MNRLLLGSLLLFAAPAALRAEEPEPRSQFNLDYRYLPSQPLRHPRAGVPGDVEVRVRPYQFRTRVSRTWKVERLGGALGVSFGYGCLKFEYENWDFARDPSRVDTLHSLQASLNYRRKLGDRWSMRLSAGPSLNSDLKRVTGKALRAHAAAGFERAVGERDTLGFGFAYAQIFGRDLVLPGVSYQHRRKSYRIELMPPARLGAFWLPRPDLDLGLLLAFSGGNYLIEAEGPLAGRRLRYSVGTLGPSLRWKLAPGCFGTLDAGAVLRHQAEVRNGQDLTRDLSPKRSYFIATGARLGF